MPRKTDPLMQAVTAALGASMRPRPDAAENRKRGCRANRSRLCFNEAAARCRGKRSDMSAVGARRLWLQ